MTRIAGGRDALAPRSRPNAAIARCDRRRVAWYATLMRRWVGSFCRRVVRSVVRSFGRSIVRNTGPVLVVSAVLGVAPLGLGPLASAVASAEPPNTHEVLQHRPSGFWTSNRPAVGGAYRWRLLGLGVVIAAVTGYGMLRLVRRANAERIART
jgi:hypothetical protein